MCAIQQTSKTNETIDLSVIIVNHNTRRLLQQCLQSIYDTTDDLSVEIFVVDNASSDGSQEMVRSEFSEVRLIANEEALGFVRAVNLGFPRGGGNYFLLAHPDTVFLPGTIKEMLSFLTTHSEVGIVGGNLVYPDGDYNECSIKKRSIRRELVEFFYASFRGMHKRMPWLHRSLNSTRDTFYWDHSTDTESDVVWNACMMFKREVLETIGNFSEDFFIWFADVDWCYRAKNAGWKIYYLLNAKVVHYETRSGDFIESDQVRYKTRPGLVSDKVAKDRHTLLKRHYSSLYLGFVKTIETMSYWITNFKLVILRVRASSR